MRTSSFRHMHDEAKLNNKKTSGFTILEETITEVKVFLTGGPNHVALSRIQGRRNHLFDDNQRFLNGVQTKMRREYCQRDEKAVERGDRDTNCNWCPWNSPQGCGKETGEMEIRERIETIHTTAISRSTRILKRVRRPEKTCCHSDSSE